MAQDLQGNLYDPYHGADDLQQRILRHVSPAFVEDPLRVLRVARFAARYHHLGFTIAPETLQLMQTLTQQGELQHLTAERVWAETEKALNEKNPEIYFETLRQVGALAVLFPELDALYGVPNPAKYHPEIDSFVHTMMVLQQATLLSEQVDCHKSAVRFAAICHDLGKAKTPKSNWPHHHGHEKLGITPTRNLCKRLKVPSYYQQLAELTCEYHTHIHKIVELRPETVVKLFNTFDVWRKPLRFMEFLLVCFADTRGRKGFEHSQYPQQEFALTLYQAALKVDVQSIIAAGFEHKAIRDQLNRGRIFAVKQKRAEILPHFSPPTITQEK